MSNLAVVYFSKGAKEFDTHLNMFWVMDLVGSFSKIFGESCRKSLAGNEKAYTTTTITTERKHSLTKICRPKAKLSRKVTSIIKVRSVDCTVAGA